MGQGNFFKNLFGSAKETASEVSGKAEVVLDKAKETATAFARKQKNMLKKKSSKPKKSIPKYLKK